MSSNTQVRDYSSVFCFTVKPWCPKHYARVSVVAGTPITTVPTAAVVVTSHSLTGTHAHRTTYSHKFIHTHAHTHAHPQPLTLTHSYTHTRTRTHAHTHAHTHTHTGY